MKKTRISLCLLFSLIIIVLFSGCTKTTHFFRSVDFGMRRDEVKKAETSLGEPASVLNNNSFLYRAVTFTNMGGDLIYSFDDSNKLTSILFYAYEEYYTDEKYNELMAELKKTYKGYTPATQDGSAVINESWKIEGKNITISTEYSAGKYLLIRFNPAN